MFSSRQECISFMKTYDKQFEELILFLGDVPERLPTNSCSRAREMLRALKGSLHEYLRTASAQRDIPDMERQYCFPAIQGASAQLRIGPNRRPSSAWIGELVAAQEDISYCLHQLAGTRTQPSTREADSGPDL